MLDDEKELTMKWVVFVEGAAGVSFSSHEAARRYLEQQAIGLVAWIEPVDDGHAYEGNGEEVPF